jgi:hypothetical protein
MMTSRGPSKSKVFDYSIEYAKGLGGEVVKDVVENGIRMVTYLLPDGRRWTFCSPSTGPT